MSATAEGNTIDIMFDGLRQIQAAFSGCKNILALLTPFSQSILICALIYIF